MNKKILCIGDSFTYGYELDNRYTQAFPNLLSLNGWDVVNLGVPGLSMDGCIRILFEVIDNNYDLVIFGCPTWCRHEVYSTLLNKPITFNPNGNFNHEVVPWHSDFFKNSYDDLYYYKRWLTKIIQLQSFFKQTNQKYIMHAVYELIPHNYQPSCSALINKIDKDSFLEWPNSLFGLVKHLPIGPELHPLKDGHRLIADLIQRQIDRQKLI